VLVGGLLVAIPGGIGIAWLLRGITATDGGSPLAWLPDNLTPEQRAIRAYLEAKAHRSFDDVPKIEFVGSKEPVLNPVWIAGKFDRAVWAEVRVTQHVRSFGGYDVINTSEAIYYFKNGEVTEVSESSSPGYSLEYRYLVHDKEMASQWARLAAEGPGARYPPPPAWARRPSTIRPPTGTPQVPPWSRP
jgi:hypothetical protein